ncbi:MAG: polysaccharide deacetylase family protein [Syntrophomonas sp.]
MSSLIVESEHNVFISSMWGERRSATHQAPSSNDSERNTQHQISIPILMYHEVGEGPNNLFVPNLDFYAQMKYLQENGYQTITLAQASIMLAARQDTSKKVVLTFDDGCASFYHDALPVLDEMHQTATFFIISDLVDAPGYVTWEQVEKLSNLGIEIGGHTKTHPLLAQIDPLFLDSEIAGNKKDIEAKTALKITSFCYPSGSYSPQVVAKVKEAGYTAAVTMEPGMASSENDPFLLPRWGVLNKEPLRIFINHIQ